VTLTRLSAPPAAGMAATGVIGGVLIGQGNVIGGQAAGVIRPAPFDPATSDSNGRFVFSNLQPGNYILRGSANGYAAQQLPSQVAGEGMLRR